jgi:hypothetical protein
VESVLVQKLSWKALANAVLPEPIPTRFQDFPTVLYLQEIHGLCMIRKLKFAVSLMMVDVVKLVVVTLAVE